MAAVGAISVGDVASLGVAVGTIALAVGTFVLARKTAEAVEASREISLDSVKARLDARAPMVSVFVAEPDWPPLAPPALPDGEPQPYPPGQEFILPRDADRPIMLRARVTIANDGPTHAHVQLYDGCEPLTARPDLVAESNGRFRVAPQTRAEFWFKRSQPLSAWVKAWDARATAPPESSLRFQVTVQDAFDEGVTDIISVEIQGYPVEPAKDKSGAWKIRPGFPMMDQSVGLPASVVYPRTRHYYASKEHLRVLGESVGR